MKKKIFYLSLLFMSLSASHASISKEKDIPKRNSFLHKKRETKKNKEPSKITKKIIIQYLIALSFVVLILLLPVAIYDMYINGGSQDYTLNEDIMDRIKEEHDKHSDLFNWLSDEIKKLDDLNLYLMKFSYGIMNENEADYDGEDKKNITDEIESISIYKELGMDELKNKMEGKRKKSLHLIDILKKQKRQKNNDTLHESLSQCENNIATYNSILISVIMKKNMNPKIIKFNLDLDKFKNKKFKELEGAEGNLSELYKITKTLHRFYKQVQEELIDWKPQRT